MKKIFALFTLLALLLLSFSASAGTFDKISTMDGYRVGNNGDWAFEKTCTLEADTIYVISLKLQGKEDVALAVPRLFIGVFNENGDTEWYPHYAIFTIDGAEFNFEGLEVSGNYSFCSLGTVGMEFLKAFSSAQDVKISIASAEYCMKTELPGTEFDNTLKIFSNTILEYDIYSFFSDELLLSADTMYNASVTYQ